MHLWAKVIAISGYPRDCCGQSKSWIWNLHSLFCVLYFELNPVNHHYLNVIALALGQKIDTSGFTWPLVQGNCDKNGTAIRARQTNSNGNNSENISVCNFLRSNICSSSEKRTCRCSLWHGCISVRNRKNAIRNSSHDIDRDLLHILEASRDLFGQSERGSAEGVDRRHRTRCTDETLRSNR
jgi:hypothetical protein